ncbi:leucyl aminopeptidase family protein [Actinophytocola xanthii]|uniref:Probable cytosol aminopeptidase n=1 Tax=Actinophytocola xanthii TaxID=1912961 RepID=A0A1Q8CML4_9PSEU|nr:leucyl aminopeptidase family protein [Actinophytocola xanthii]OLF15592.1 peptidase M17 [Actinophytocola xanthii]
MVSSVPAVPTALPQVEVVPTVRRADPLAVVVNAADRSVPGREADLTEEWADTVGLTGKAGEVHAGPVGSAVRWVVGVGEGEPGDWRCAGGALARSVNAAIASDDAAGRSAVRVLTLELPDGVGAEEVGQLVLGLRLGGYAYVIGAEAATPRLRTVRLVAGDRDLAPIVDRASTLARATALARDLANTPSNVKDPAWLARMAERTAGRAPGVRVTVHDERWLAEQGFGGVLAVGGGSTRPPRLVELTYASRRDAPHVVLVGKGITFDTGGISVKPADGMHLMRTDMAGGAAVIAAVEALAALAPDVRVTALVPCAENHLSGSAYRPGDVVRHFGGRTTAVTNTDAEGRMVMADAIAYAVARLSPDLLVDVATLTGAMKVSLGLRTGGVFASEDGVWERVSSAGSRAGERWWRMPLGSDAVTVADEFAETVHDAGIADVAQSPQGPGAIAAAMFLREFTGGLPWAHLDIAGPARAERPYDEVAAGATGFAARTLVELVAAYEG